MLGKGDGQYEPRELMRVFNSVLTIVAVSFIFVFVVGLVSGIRFPLAPLTEMLLTFLNISLCLFSGYGMYRALGRSGARAERAKRIMMTSFGGASGLLVIMFVIEILLGFQFDSLGGNLFLTFIFLLTTGGSYLLSKKLFPIERSDNEEAPKGAKREVNFPLSQKSRVRVSVILSPIVGYVIAPVIAHVAEPVFVTEYSTVRNFAFLIMALVSVVIFYEVLPAVKRKFFPTHRAGRPLQILLAVLTFFAAGVISFIGYFLLINFIRTTLIRSDAVILPAALPYVGLVLAIATAFFVATGYLFSGAKRL